MIANSCMRCAYDNGPKYSIKCNNSTQMLLCGFPMVDFIPKLYHNHDITFASLSSLFINWLPCKLIFLCGSHLLRMILPVGLALLQTYWYRVVEYMVLIRALLINKMCSFSRSFNLFEPNHPCTYNAKYEKMVHN